MKKKFAARVLLFGLLLAILASANCVFDTSGIKLSFYISKSHVPPHACLGASYFFQFSALNGTTPYAWDLVMGTLPTGVKLGADGILKGTPTAGGTFTFTVRVKDSSKPELSYSEEYSVTVDTFAITDPDSTLDYCPGVPFDHAIQTCGGQAPLTWSHVSGNMPSGFSVSQGGHIQGTSSDAKILAGTIQAVDAAGKTAQKYYVFSGKAAVSILNSSILPEGESGTAYSPVQLKACGGSGSYSWSSSSGDLPAGLSLSGSGLLSGTPAETGSFIATFFAKDNNPPNNTGSKAFFITVAPGPLVISTTAPLATAFECVAYASALQASGGSGTYTWSLAAGSHLPAGLSLDAASGKISGTPSQPMASPYSFTVTVNDGSATASKALTLLVEEDKTVSSDLVITEVRHGPGSYDILHLALTGTPVRIDFRFSKAGLLARTVTQARLQCVGDCSTVSTTTISSASDFNNDGQNERMAQFSGTLALALVSAAGKNAGDAATLRIWIDMIVDGKAVTYKGRAAVQVAQ